MTRRSACAVRALGFFAFSIFVFGAADALADAGPPLLTDDPGTPGDGHWEINFAWTAERSAAMHHDEAPLADFNYGVGESVQLNFEMPWVADSGRGNNGFGNAEIAVKWRFLDQGDGGWQVSTYPRIEFLPPGLHHATSADPGVSYLFPIEVQRGFGTFDANFEIGRTLAPASGDDGWIAGIAMGHKLSERFELLAELHDETAGGWNAQELVFDVGARAMLSQHFTLLASLGGDVDNSMGPRNRWVSYLGLQLHL